MTPALLVIPFQAPKSSQRRSAGSTTTDAGDRPLLLTKIQVPMIAPNPTYLHCLSPEKAKGYQTLRRSARVLLQVREAMTQRYAHRIHPLPPSSLHVWFLLRSFKRGQFVTGTRSSSETTASTDSSAYTLFRRPRVSAIRPSKSLAFHTFTPQPLVDQRTQSLRSPPRLKQAISTPHVSSQYRHHNNMSIRSAPLEHHVQLSLSESCQSQSISPTQSRWSISTESATESPRRKGLRWATGLKRLFGRLR